MSWQEWKRRLEEYCEQRYGHPYGPLGPIGECGEECWRENYEKGDTPEEALEMDRTYWE